MKDNSKQGATKTEISFYKKRKCWYAEVPEHTEAQNLMVSGADVLCETMAVGKKRVTVSFLSGDGDHKPTKGAIVSLQKVSQTAYGATYSLQSADNNIRIPDKCWLCNVTKTVCNGSHPDWIDIMEITPNDGIPYGWVKKAS